MSNSCAVKYIKKLDFVGPEFNFENDESSTYQSTSGIILSLLTLIAISVISFLFGQEMYQRRNPNVAMSKIFNYSSSYKIDDFPVIFTFHNSNGFEVKNIEQFLDFHAVYHEMDNESKTTNTLLPILPCKSLNVTYNSDIINKFINGPFKAYCLKSDNRTILNTVGNQNSKFLRYRFLLCNEKNERRPNKCFLDPQILGQSITISISHLNTYIDSNNFTNPIIDYLDRLIQPISPGLFKIVTFSVNNNVFYSDDGWLIEDFKKMNYLQMMEKRIDVSLSASTADNVVMNLLLESPFLINKINRNYLKLQELFARVGGLANAFYIIIKVLSYDYLRFKYLFFLRNESFGKMDNNIKFQNMKGLAKSLVNKRQSNAFLENFARINIGIIDEIKCLNENLDKKGQQKDIENISPNKLIDNESNKNNIIKLEKDSRIKKIPGMQSNQPNNSNLLLLENNDNANYIPLALNNNNEIHSSISISSNSLISEKNSDDNNIEMKHNEIKYNTQNIALSKNVKVSETKYESKTENLNNQKENIDNVKKSISVKLNNILEKNKDEIKSFKNLSSHNLILNNNSKNQKEQLAKLKFDEKGVLMKENVSKMLFGDQEYEYSEKPNYLKYRINSLLCCLKNENLENVYDFELNRVKMILDIKLFKHFLIESYAKHYYVDSSHNQNSNHKS